MRILLSWVGALSLLALALGLAAGAERRQQVCVQLGLCKQSDFMGSMLVSVQRQQKLLVLTARLVAPVTSARETTVGPLTIGTTRQTAILPATVAYVVDLSLMKEGDLRWEPETETLNVKRPPVTPLEPTIQWEKALTYEDNNLVSVLTSVSDNLRQDNQEKAPAEFLRQSRAPELMKLADSAADEALEATFRMALIATGYHNAEVVVTR